MALINNLYVFVEDEQVNREITSTTHPVEKGIDLTDSIKNKPFVISLKGKVVDHGNVKAEEILSKIYSLQKKGSLISYSGRNVAKNLQIQSFNSTHPNTIWGGFEFDMELKEVRIAKKAYTAPKKAAATTGDIKVGSIVVFKGGSVYVSSDAKTAAATRGRSTCKCTIISTASYSIHQYHLISTDGQMVYGWVDKANIEMSGNTSNTAATTNAGTQQVTKTNTEQTAVYHTIKKGDDLSSIASHHTNTLNNAYEKTTNTRNVVMSPQNKNINTLLELNGDKGKENMAIFSGTGPFTPDFIAEKTGAKICVGYTDAFGNKITR